MSNELKIADVELVLQCPSCKRRYFPQHGTIPPWCACSKDENKQFLGMSLHPSQRVEKLVNALMDVAALEKSAEFPFAVQLVPKCISEGAAYRER